MNALANFVFDAEDGTPPRFAHCYPRVIGSSPMSHNTFGVSANELIFIAAVRELAAASRSGDEDRRRTQHHFAEAMRLSIGIDDEQLVDDFYELYCSSRMHCAWISSRQKAEVSGTQVRFREQLSALIPGAVFCDRPNVKTKKRPDAWVLLNGEVIPVEVKSGAFGSKALTQLLGYMQIYGTRRGIAVAPRLTCRLPDGVVFVAVR